MRRRRSSPKSRRRVGAILLILLAGSVLLWWVLKPPPPKPPPPVVQPSPAPEPSREPPPAATGETMEAVEKGKIAIVIDDLGRNYQSFEKLIDIGVPMTFSILPGLRYSRTIASKAHDRNYEVMLHLPMQPENPIHDPGGGAIREGMDPDEVHRRTREDLQSVPYVVGVNNHMGSRATQNFEIMAAVLEVVRNEGLYFLDSKTTPKSVAYQKAREMGIPAAERQVFLDDVDGLDEIRIQMDTLERIAARRGEAIAIGHPRSRTIQVLRERLPRMKAEGYRLVFLSDLVE